jgi:hypothetical protein
MQAVLLIRSVKDLSYQMCRYSLRWIICCICEELGENAMFHSIAAGNEYPMDISLHKVIIK